MFCWALTIILLLANLPDVTHSTGESKVYQLVYENFDTDTFDVCVRLTNGTSQVGCQSSINGNVGVLFHFTEVSNLTDLNNATNAPYAVLIQYDLLNSQLVNSFLQSGKVSGILAYHSEKYKIPSSFSPASKCPNLKYGLYGSNYGPNYATCNNDNQWNPEGDYLYEQDIGIPVFVVKNQTVIDQLIKCYDSNNKDKSYPLCAAELTSFTYSAQSSETCLRRNGIDVNLATMVYCDVMGGHNLFTSITATNNTQPLEEDSIILATASFDARSFMSSYTAPATNQATGFITLLAVVEAIGKLSTKEKQSLGKNIAFLFLDGESFDYMGSKKVTFDMAANKFPLAIVKGTLQPAVMDTSHLSHVVEFGQLGHMTDTVTAHYDTVAYDDQPSIKASTDDLISLFNRSSNLTFSKPTVSKGLPPASLHSFLRQRNVTGVLLADYDTQYSNKYYGGRFDTLSSLGVHFERNATEDQIKDALKPLAEKLTAVATASANTLFQTAGGNDETKLSADMNTVVNLLFCVLHNESCEFLNRFNNNPKRVLTNGPMNRYISGYSSSSIANVNYFIRTMLTRFVGEELPVENCTQPEKNFIYTYSVFNDTCVRAQVLALDGSTPYKSIENYDYASSEYQVWTEARWGQDSMKLRMFLISQKEAATTTLVAGLLMFATSLLVTFLIQRKRSILFPSSVEQL